MMKVILKTTLLAGTLDIVAAFINAYSSNNVKPGRVLQFIASGAFGKEAFSGGYPMMALGLLFHFMIAFACTAIFFLIYPRLQFLRKSILLNSILVALAAWVVTTFIVIPLSRIHQIALHLDKSLLAIGILFICIGLPLSWFAKKYYATSKPK